MKPTLNLPSPAFLEDKVAKLKVAKGPFSVIVKTVEEALRSGTVEDLRRGALALDIYEQLGEQRGLAQIPRRLAPIQLPTVTTTNNQMVSNRTATPPAAGRVAKSKASAPTVRSAEMFIPSHDIDFSRPDSLSTSKRRHLLARRTRRS